MNDTRAPARLGLLMGCCALLLSACGGGGPDAGSPGTPPPPPPAGNAARIAAATATAQSATNACAAIRPFYWEIGDRAAALASGAVGSSAYGPGTTMNIASASKWLYGAYVVQRRAGVLSAQDIQHLTFRSGYTRFAICLPGQTVDGCLNYLNNGVKVDASVGRFDYGGGHMQKHASLIGLGGMNNAALAAELRSQLGADIALTFSQPQPAGGVVSTPADYARFLRRLLDGTLALGSRLGSEAVCTNPLTCPTADSTPVPSTESWHYALGHWVEDDPQRGDGAFSSAGAFGFYPWIDAGRSHYGIVAREAAAGSGEASANCGRLIRKAWVTAAAN